MSGRFCPLIAPFTFRRPPAPAPLHLIFLTQLTAPLHSKIGFQPTLLHFPLCSHALIAMSPLTLCEVLFTLRYILKVEHSIPKTDVAERSRRSSKQERSSKWAKYAAQNLLAHCKNCIQTRLEDVGSAYTALNKFIKM